MDFVAFAQELIAQYGLLGLFISSILMNAMIILPMPMDIVIFSAGALANHDLFWNPIVIGLVAGLAAAIGELTSWAVGWETNQLALKKAHGENYLKAERIFKKYGFYGIILFSFMPFPLDVMGLLAGALKYDVKKYFAACLIGKIPKYWVLAFAGFYGAKAVLAALSWGF